MGAGVGSTTYSGVRTEAGRSASTTAGPDTNPHGMTPAQMGSPMSSSASSGPSERTFADASSMGSRTTAVARSSLSVGGRASLAPPGRHVVDDREQGPELLVGVVNRRPDTEEDHRPVVHRMVEGGPGEDDPVEESDRHADRGTRGDRLQHGVGRGSVQVDDVAAARIGGRQHNGRAVLGKAHVADEPLVEDGVDGPAIVGAALFLPTEGRARRAGRVRSAQPALPR